MEDVVGLLGKQALFMRRATGEKPGLACSLPLVIFSWEEHLSTRIAVGWLVRGLPSYKPPTAEKRGISRGCLARMKPRFVLPQLHLLIIAWVRPSTAATDSTAPK